MNMKQNSMTNLMMMVMILTTVILTLSSNTFLWMWLSLEINSIVILPIMMVENNLKSMEQMMKYFLFQSISSNMMLFVFISSSLMKLNTKYLEISKVMFFMALMMKMGLAPLHTWMTNLVESLKWWTFFIFMTLQKISPFLIFMMFSKLWITTILILMNSVIGSISGLNQSSMRKIMFFSSINHSSWIFMTLMTSFKMFKFYFMMYTTFLYLLTKKLTIMKVSFIHQLFTSKKVNNYLNLEQIMLMTIMIFFMGMPPLVGFFPKFNIMMWNMIYMKTIMTIMIMLNLLSMTFYMRVTMNLMINNKMKLKDWSKPSDETLKSQLFIMLMMWFYLNNLIWNFKLKNY